MEKLFGVVRKAANTARTIVSGDRYRFTEDGFDLDLVYVTPNIIAMGYPAEGPESAWRNNINDVARFFRTKHPGHFKIFNLCEKTYDIAKLDNMVKNWAWADNYPPLLLTLWHLLEEMDHWLSQDPLNVIAVHCKNGRGRTGVAIASYLLYKRVVTDADEALKYFNRKRSVVGEGVTIPSQKRYVKYIEMLSNHQIPITLVHTPKRVRLHKLILRPVPVADISGKGCRLWFEIFQSPTTMKNVEPLFATKPERKYLEEEAAMSLPCDLEVQGDICVKVFHKTQVTSKVSIGANLFLFRFSFHTSFVNDYFHDFTLKELEGEENPLNEDKKENAAKKKPIFLEPRCWVLLLDLLTDRNLATGSTIVHTKLLTVVSLTFNAVFTEISIGKKEDDQHKLLSTAHSVLELLLTKFETAFKPTFEQFGQFIGDMINIQAHFTTNDVGHNASAVEAYLAVLDLALKEFARQLADQPNQKKVFSLLVEKLLVGLLTLRFKLHSITESKIAAHKTAVLSSLESLMGEYIFHPEHVHEFAMSYTATRAKEEDSKTKGDEEPKAKRQKTGSGTYLGNKIFSYPKKFFDVLREMISKPATIGAALHSFEFVYRAFLRTMNDDRAKKIVPNLKVKKDALKRKEKAVLIEQYSEFNFMMELHDMLNGFVALNATQEELIRTVNNNEERAVHTALALAAMNGLLDTVIQFNVYSIPLDTSDRYQYHFFLNLSTALVRFLATNKDSLTLKAMPVIENTFTGFKYLLQLNHNVVEPKLEPILHAAWCLNDQQFTEPVQSFSITLVNTYALLRQFDKFLQLLLTSMHKIKITAFFPHHSYWKAFNTSVENLPPLQLVQLWKQLSESIFSDYITPVLMQEPSVNYLHAVNLFCEFIEHVKITEANVNQINELVSDNFSMMVAPLLITIIDSSKSGLKQPDAVVFATLLMYYSLTRLATFIKYRFSGSLDHTESSVALPSFFSSIQENNVQLSEFIETFMKTKSIELKFILIVLAVERCKQLFRHMHVIRSQHFDRIVGALYGQTSKTVESELDAENQKCQKELNMLFSLLHRSVQGEYKVNNNTSEFWDGRIVSIKRSNFTAALLTLFCENIHIWTDCASLEELQQFSTMILNAGSLLARSHWRVSDPISVLLSNATFFEIPKVQDALLEGFSKRLVSALQSVPNQQLIESRREITTENIMIQLDEVVSSAGIRLLGGEHKVPSISSTALTPVIHDCDLLLALPLAPSSTQVQKCVALLCTVSWYTPHNSAELTTLHKLIAKLVQIDWNCNECILVNYLVQTNLYHMSEGSDLVLRAYINNICDTKRDKQRVTTLEKRTVQLSNNMVVLFDGKLREKAVEMTAKILAYISCFYAEKEAHCKYLKQSKSITKETVDELEVRFFIPKFVTTLVQELQKRIHSAVNVQHKDSSAQLTQIEVQLSLLNFYRLYSSKFRERDRNEETFNVDFDAFVPHIGRLTQLTINELLRPLEANKDAMEVDQSDGSLKSRVLSSLLTVADCLPVLSSLNIKGFGLLIAVVFDLLIRAHDNHEESKQIERIYIHVIQNATKEQIELMLDHLKIETRVDNLITENNASNARLMTSMDCLLLFLTHTAASIRYQIMNKQAQVILSNCLTLVTTVSPPQSASSEHLVIKACEIMNRLVVDSFTKLKSRHLALMLQLFSPFMLNEASSVNGGTDKFSKEYLISEPVFTALYFLLINTLKSRQYEAFKVIAPLLDGIKYLLRQIVRARPDGSYLPAICIQNFSRLCEELAKNKIVTKKFAEYFLVDFVVLVKLTSLPPKIKQHLMPGVYSMMDTCTEYENQQIFAALDDVSKGIFKGMYNEYNRDHKFSGKV